MIMLKPIYLLFISILFLSGCANMQPKRITDVNDINAKGIRYYETRPFILVRKPYPIAAETFLVDGQISPDGQWVKLTNVPAGIKNFLSDGQLSNNLIFRSGSFAPNAQGEAPDQSGDESSQSDDTAPADTSEDLPETDQPKGKTTGKPSGTATVVVQTDHTGFSHIPVNELFSIIYLPDFDREFVIDASAKLGITRLNLTRGPGGALVAMNADVDNSAITGPITDAYRILTESGTSYLKSSLFSVPGIPVAQGEAGVAVAVAPRIKDAGKISTVTLRIHKVKFAVPGAYPMAKNSEVANASTELGAHASGRTYVVPVRQYQVPYDYFELVVAEHVLQPAGSSVLVDQASTESGQASGGANGAGSARNAPLSGGCKGRLTQPMNATKVTELLTPPEGIAIIDTKLTGAGGCYERIDIQYTVVDGVDHEVAVKGMKAAWKKRYPDTVANFKKKS